MRLNRNHVIDKAVSVGSRRSRAAVSVGSRRSQAVVLTAELLFVLVTTTVAMMRRSTRNFWR